MIIHQFVPLFFLVKALWMGFIVSPFINNCFFEHDKKYVQIYYLNSTIYYYRQIRICKIFFLYIWIVNLSVLLQITNSNRNKIK